MNAREVVLTVGGVGHVRSAPGTVGSLPQVAFAFVLAAGSVPRWAVDGSLLTVGVVLAAACVLFGGWAEAYWRREDPQAVVADEVAGQTLPLLVLPWGDALAWNATLAATAFLAFRGFDVTKLAPIATSQAAPSGWGILVDDLVAGAYAAAVTQAVVRVVLPALAG